MVEKVSIEQFVGDAWFSLVLESLSTLLEVRLNDRDSGFGPGKSECLDECQTIRVATMRKSVDEKGSNLVLIRVAKQTPEAGPPEVLGTT